MDKRDETVRVLEMRKREGCVKTRAFVDRNMRLHRLAAKLRAFTHGRADPVRAIYLKTAWMYRQIKRVHLAECGPECPYRSVCDQTPSAFGDIEPGSIVILQYKLKSMH